MRWLENGNSANWAEFRSGEDPRRMKSVHAWFFKNGKCVNHSILQSRYILENYTLEAEQGETDDQTSNKRGPKRRNVGSRNTGKA